MANGTNLATLGPAMPVLPLLSVNGVPKNVKLYIFRLQHIVSDECKIDVVFFMILQNKKYIFNFFGTHLYLTQARQLGLAEKFWGEINLVKQ